MKKVFFTSILFILVILNTAIAQTVESEPILKVGLIADIQYGDCESKGSRFYRESLNKLREAVKDLNVNNVQFTINLGDFVDRNFSDLDSVMLELGKLNGNMYNVTGNHDYVGITDNKVLCDRLFMPSDYYSLSLPRAGVLFLFLNSNEISHYSNIKGTDKEVQLVEIEKRLKAENRKNNYPWNGGFSNEQLQWFENQLKSAQSADAKVIVCLHHPLYPENNHNALNDREILEIMSRYSCVKAVLSGHNHAGNFGQYHNIPFVTVEGMIETNNENAYGVVEIFKDKLIIKGRGRVTSREMKF